MTVFYFRSLNSIPLQTKSSLRNLWAILLTLVFTTAWSLNSLHDLLLHHEHPVCEAAYDGKGTHIHDERYEAHGCTLCALLLSAPELMAAPSFPARVSTLPESEAPNFYHAPAQLAAAFDNTLRRGPPVR
ncbi:MAG: hypothetical protein DYG98_01475 [Haliscomenobacteraceae bacterium CHB4]|nr:hypothetical protein [Haliscomenobacteraceae bacterium CHB4]